jgi:hypothetical protein
LMSRNSHVTPTSHSYSFYNFATGVFLQRLEKNIQSILFRMLLHLLLAVTWSLTSLLLGTSGLTCYRTTEDGIRFLSPIVYTDDEVSAIEEWGPGV